ncbi:hypothetical protein Tco_1047272 [Tanacetum coccineum]
MVYFVDGARAVGVETNLMMDFVRIALLKLEIHSLMIQTRILSIILRIIPTTFHSPSSRHIRASYVGTILTMKEEEKRIAEEQAAKISISRKFPIYNDDDDKYSIQTQEYLKKFSSANTPDLPIEEPVNSLSMGDEHLDTIPATKSDEVIKSSVKDPVPIPSECEVISDDDCDLHLNDDLPESHFTTFSNPLFDSNDDFSSDDESLSEEEIQKDEFKYFSNPLYDLDDEIITNEKILPNQKDLDVVIPIPPGIDERCFNAESDLLESLLNRDSPIDSTKIDSIFDEFSLPRPPEESNSEISDATIESLSPSPILVEDSDSLMEEIDLFLASDDSMPTGIEIVDYDSEGDIRFLEELLSNDSLPLPENESFSLDHFDDPSLSRPPPEPPDVEICFNFEPDAGVVTKKVVGDISEHDVLMPNLLPTQPTLCPMFDLLLPFSSENEDKVFKPGIFSSPFSSHFLLLSLIAFESFYFHRHQALN